MSRTIALVPVKPLVASKSRLAPTLSDDERIALSARLLEHVLTALREAKSVDACRVIGGDAVVEALAARHDARWLPELGTDLNDTLTRALEQLPADVARALILPMDLPFLTGQAVDALVAQLAEDRADVIIAPDRWQQGTNALLLTRSFGSAQCRPERSRSDRPFGLHLAFGSNSLTRHQEAATSQGLRVALHNTRELAFDIDTPADLAESGLRGFRISGCGPLGTLRTRGRFRIVFRAQSSTRNPKPALSPVEGSKIDVLVIGGGMAGMVVALRAAEAGTRVLLLARSAPGTECNSAVSGGGFFMACTDLSEAEHRQLTMEAGCHINQPELVDALSRNAPACREWLEATIGFPLNVKDDGKGYWCPGGGANLSAKLAEAVARTERITIRSLQARELLAADGVCYGVVAEDSDGTPHRLTASATVLATGGYAGLFARHDNPGAPIGTGVVMAARAGARLRDLEFVQFYPVAVAEPGLPTFMLFRPFPPEVRLVTADGRDLLAEHFGGMDLNEAIGAERDELSRAIHAANQRGQVYFDATGCDWSRMDHWFSLRYLSRYDFDWANKRARVAPIAHHTMGGVWIDAQARTSLRRLYAAGEVTGGVHGANRHGSNSLTDCLVLGSIAGAEAAGEVPLSTVPDEPVPLTPSGPERAAFPELQRICWEGLGIVRDAAGMAEARQQLVELPPSDARLMADMMAAFAERRAESRGAHFRADHPTEEATWQRSQSARLVSEELHFE